MTTQPPADPSAPDPRTPAAIPPSEARHASSAPPSTPPAVDWPDRSHWSEFDAAIEAQLAATEAAPAPEGEARPG